MELTFPIGTAKMAELMAALAKALSIEPFHLAADWLIGKELVSLGYGETVKTFNDRNRYYS